MNIEILSVGELHTNCYLIIKDDKCLIIDPGDDENFIVSRITELEITPVAILITHNHPDHNKYALSLKEMYNIEIYDYNNLFEQKHFIDPFKFEVIYTPGHTKDSISLYFYEYAIIFVGDFIFYENIGRIDLEGGSYNDMVRSIEKIKRFDDDIKIYPGHGPSTTIEHELKYNKFLN